MLQVIDDSVGNTLVAASTLTPEIREKLNGGGGSNTVRIAPSDLAPSDLARHKDTCSLTQLSMAVCFFAGCC